MEVEVVLYILHEFARSQRGDVEANPQPSEEEASRVEILWTESSWILRCNGV
jgi:hypothetical protein